MSTDSIFVYRVSTCPINPILPSGVFNAVNAVSSKHKIYAPCRAMPCHFSQTVMPETQEFRSSRAKPLNVILAQDLAHRPPHKRSPLIVQDRPHCLGHPHTPLAKEPPILEVRQEHAIMR